MDSRRPEFTGRVQRDKIQRLYESDAKGMLDEELVDDIGISLLTRIESIFRAGKAIFGEAWCPHCGRPIQHQHRARCRQCRRYPTAHTRKQLKQQSVDQQDQQVHALSADHISALNRD